MSDFTTYNQVLIALNVNLTNLQQELLDINTEILTSGPSQFISVLVGTVGFSQCSGAWLQYMDELIIENNLAAIDAISQIPEVYDIFVNTGLNSQFSCNQSSREQVFTYLQTFHFTELRDVLISLVPGGSDTERKEWIVSWYKDNDLTNFLYLGTMLNSANIATIQSSRIPLYGGVLNHIETYFQLIKENYGQSFYDQLWSHFSNTGSYYADSLKILEWHIYGSSRIGICKSDALISVINGNDQDQNGELSADEYISSSLQTISYNYTSYSYYRGLKNYELTNHLGNVLVVVSDRKINQCNSSGFIKASAVVVSATDYSPFGAPLAGRTWQASEYRFSFNGQEQDNEIAGDGNIMTAEFWEYDTRLGRRWNLDPIKKAWRSDYHAFGNKPILNIDPNGDNAGKYYDKDGNEVGNDQVDDGKSYVVADRKEAEDLNTNTLNKINPKKGEVKSAIELPSYSVRQEMGKSIEASNSPNKEDETGGFHEEGGAWGVTGDGMQKVVPAIPGPYANPSEEPAVMNPLLPQNPEDANLMEIYGTYHVHPSGIIRTERNVISNNSNPHFQSSPTDPDDYKYHETHNFTRYSIVFGARKGETTLYNGDAKLLIIKTSVFLSIGRP